ncbi:MAG: dual specificity protein phosphatase family protein [Myxococcales bacterium]|nr:dual specificity protein phosphatase family protein [Myxococcales bacterium]
MPQQLAIDEVATGLWLGPCPKSPGFIQSLASDFAITSLVSVQTDEDLVAVGMNWPLMWDFLMRSGISAKRTPIVDFDDDALRDGLETAVAAVQSARQAGRVTYLHCTAGVNRSPSVAIGWLVAHGGLDLDTAWRQVTERRSCAPNRRALEHWLARR